MQNEKTTPLGWPSLKGIFRSVLQYVDDFGWSDCKWKAPSNCLGEEIRCPRVRKESLSVIMYFLRIECAVLSMHTKLL